MGPRTFVSGFFGMNTANIRDVEATQYLYWSIAVPVTLLVLTFALIYGYRGDDIDDWIHGVLHPNSPRRQAPTRASEAKNRMVSRERAEASLNDRGEKGEAKFGWYRRLGSNGKKRRGAMNRMPTWASQMGQEHV
jgi:hypothetical protein